MQKCGMHFSSQSDREPAPQIRHRMVVLKKKKLEGGAESCGRKLNRLGCECLVAEEVLGTQTLNCLA
jgi:hypothetical protein